MWVTRQMTAHARCVVALLSIASRSSRFIDPLSHTTVTNAPCRIEVDDSPPFSQRSSWARRKTEKESLLRPNVGWSEVRLSRWTSLSRAFKRRRGLLSPLDKRECRHWRFLTGVYAFCRMRRVSNSLEIFRAAPQRRGKARCCIWIRLHREPPGSFHLVLFWIRKFPTTWSTCEAREREMKFQRKKSDIKFQECCECKSPLQQCSF